MQRRRPPLDDVPTSQAAAAAAVRQEQQQQSVSDDLNSNPPPPLQQQQTDDNMTNSTASTTYTHYFAIALFAALLWFAGTNLAIKNDDVKSVKKSVRSDNRTLLYVQMLFRHGDRAPERFYKNDPFTNSWPQGAGQLTPLGIEQQFALGQYLRTRYADFLDLNDAGVTYSDIFVRSTDVERAITSAQANVAAFFRPPPPSTSNSARAWQTDDNSDLGMLWQPVPIHTVPQQSDWVMQEVDCNKLESLRVDFENGPVIQAIKNEPAVQLLLQNLSNVTGEAFDQWTITSTFKSVADTLYCEHQHDMILANVSEQFYADVEQLKARTWPMPFADTGIAQLRGGCILDTFASNMRDKLDGNTSASVYSSRKLVVFSGHDTTILGLISAAGLLDKLDAQPSYTTTVFFELFADGSVDILVKSNITSFDAIRTSEPVVILQNVTLVELESAWAGMRLNETQLQAACAESDGRKRLAPLPPMRRVEKEEDKLDSTEQKTDHQL